MKKEQTGLELPHNVSQAGDSLMCPAYSGAKLFNSSEAEVNKHYK